MEIIVVSIGTLSQNPFWQETHAVRTPHATTTLVRDNDRVILVDPSLPAQALEARITERAGINAAAVTDIFLTNWRPAHRRALTAFAHASWWMLESEIQTAQQALERAAVHVPPNSDDRKVIEDEKSLLARVKPAPDKITQAVGIFPLPGFTPGQCGLLLELPTSTVIIAGDAVATAAHFAHGRVLPGCFDIEQAQECLTELYNLADLIVPGHDNLFVNPRIAGF
ncbi:MAG: MBL fold metallo-hydrolase [Phycisphaerae bacterium]|nr:MBL fold metallo-hydrolase [Phycisphaerae bacterium]